MGAATPEALIAAYGEAINTHRFAVVAPLIAQDASFWFNDGSHLGIAAIRDAFEATWARLVDERYWLEDLIWIVKGQDIAACRYRFCYTAVVNGDVQSGAGRGTCIVERRVHGWVIVHEHLSALA